ncbi:MAG: MoxR family ATPase [Azonexus sp.]|jgi:MoxR-like ATPase|nr:MoxR family ATPase [Azonexus sp.]
MSTLTPENLARAADLLTRLRAELSKAVVGQSEAVEQILLALVASGHVLIEGVPGLGKTLLARALAKTMQLTHARIQFTPDLMPSDITGYAVLDPAARGENDAASLGQLRLRRGPVFTHLLLADEINRAPAKTQSALLEVMQEYQVTLEGEAHPLPRPFMVMATQNPVDTEGTYPLPEAQIDRFLLKIEIGFPSLADETAIVQRVTGQQIGNQLPLDDIAAVLDERQVQVLQNMVAYVRVDPQVADYAVRLTRITREWPGLAMGAGSRGALALVRLARASAIAEGRDFATPDDVKQHALPVLRHRVRLSADAQLDGREVDALLQAAIDSVEAPRL